VDLPVCPLFLTNHRKSASAAETSNRQFRISYYNSFFFGEVKS
jgi:hypothetical protein